MSGTDGLTRSNLDNAIQKTVVCSVSLSRQSRRWRGIYTDPERSISSRGSDRLVASQNFPQSRVNISTLICGLRLFKPGMTIASITSKKIQVLYIHNRFRNEMSNVYFLKTHVSACLKIHYYKIRNGIV